jgi:hypothetical protein
MVLAVNCIHVAKRLEQNRVDAIAGVVRNQPIDIVLDLRMAGT